MWGGVRGTDDTPRLIDPAIGLLVISPCETADCASQPSALSRLLSSDGRGLRRDRNAIVKVTVSW